MEELSEDGVDFESWSTKVAAGLGKHLNGVFQRQVAIIEEKLAKQGRMLNGRQLAWLI